MLIEDAEIYRQRWYEKGSLHPERLVVLNLIHGNKMKCLPLFVTERGLSTKLYNALTSGTNVTNNYDFFLDLTAELSKLSNVNFVVSMDVNPEALDARKSSRERRPNRPLDLRNLNVELFTYDENGNELFGQQLKNSREKAESLLLIDNPQASLRVSDRLSRNLAVHIEEIDSLEEPFLRRYHYFQNGGSADEWTLYLTADQENYLELYWHSGRHDAPIVNKQYHAEESDNFELRKSMTGAVGLQIPALFECLNELEVSEEIPNRAYDPITVITSDLHSGKSITDEELKRTEQKIKDHLSSDDDWGQVR